MQGSHVAPSEVCQIKASSLGHFVPCKLTCPWRMPLNPSVQAYMLAHENINNADISQ